MDERLSFESSDGFVASCSRLPGGAVRIETRELGIEGPDEPGAYVFSGAELSKLRDWLNENVKD